MKKLSSTLIAAVALFCSACSPLFYQQIATLSSENVSLKDNGTYSYVVGFREPKVLLTRLRMSFLSQSPTITTVACESVYHLS